MRCLSKCLLFCLALLSVGPVLAESDEQFDQKPWQELDTQFPPSPKPESLLPFYVSAATDNRFFVDASSLSVGSDGVVRYVLVVVTPAGGRNVSFEGMRCETKSRRIYASGRQDGSWSKSRNDEWVRIRDGSGNRHHAALFLEVFCPSGIIVVNREEALGNLRQGGRSGDILRW